MIPHLLLFTQEKFDIEVECCIYLKECTVKTLNFGQKIVSITLSSRSDARLLLCMFLLFIIHFFLCFHFLFVKNISASDCSYIVLIFRAISASLFLLSLFLIKMKPSVLIVNFRML